MHYGPAEMMVVALAREIREGDIVFHGLASPVPMTAMKLAKALGKEFTYVTLSDGVDPDFTRPAVIGSTLTANTYEGSVASFGLGEIFDLAASGRLDIAFLSFVQMDREGRINMSYVGGTYDRPKVRLPGGAGSATLTPVTRRTTIWKTKHDRTSFVKEVDFATTAADPAKMFTVVSNLCVFRLHNGLLEVDSVFPYTSLDEVKANTGWEITQDDALEYPAPTEEELRALERIDPYRIRYVEF
ncbi:MAG: CoA-transferase [Syntrophomonadaceae bacterium]|nr:CoA-transferase [Syntrophomonadaceae bacterium]